jgi:hypothetical protein
MLTHVLQSTLVSAVLAAAVLGVHSPRDQEHALA